MVIRDSLRLICQVRSNIPVNTEALPAAAARWQGAGYRGRYAVSHD